MTMFTMFYITVTVICAVGIIWNLWMLICIERAHKLAISLIPEVGDEQFYPKLNACRKVKFNWVVWKYATLKNPKDLYDPIVFEGK